MFSCATTLAAATIKKSSSTLPWPVASQFFGLTQADVASAKVRTSLELSWGSWLARGLLTFFVPRSFGLLLLQRQVTVLVGGRVDADGRPHGAAVRQVVFRKATGSSGRRQSNQQRFNVHACSSDVLTALCAAVKVTRLAPLLHTSGGRVPAESWLVLSRLPNGSITSAAFQPNSGVIWFAPGLTWFGGANSAGCCCSALPCLMVLHLLTMS